MRTWLDITFGKHGQWVWIPTLGVTIFPALFVWLSFPLPYPFSPAGSVFHIVNMITAGVLLLPPFAWGVVYISQVRLALQEITLDDKRLLGKFYYGRKVELRASDITWIGYYAMTWKIRQINLYDRNIPGIEIRLQDDHIIRINVKTEDFPSLVDALKAYAKAGQIDCSL